MYTIEVNNRHIQTKDGETILDACNRAGIKVPTLCHIEGLFPTGACRMCVVEVEGMDGLVPSCAWPVKEGMKVNTFSPKALKARKTIIELLLADHPDDCLYCVRNGDCELQGLAEELGVRQRRYSGKKSQYDIDSSSSAIFRDPAKCILCGKCVRVCEEIQGVSSIDFIERGCKTEIGTAFREGLNVSSCVNCGQCVIVCPTGALREKSNLKVVIDAINDPEKIVIAQHAPSISVTLGEEFGIKPGRDVVGIMTSALRKLGFDRVFDTSFSADLTILEEGSELVHRIKNGGALPMMTSCSPGWIKFVEEFYPEYIPNLSSCKSPQNMLGAVIKSYYAEKENLDKKKIFNVGIMPCSAKKFEAERPEMNVDGLRDIDAVLTTRELARLIKMYGMSLHDMEPEIADNPFAERSSAGKLFGATGGVMEAAVRTAYYLLTGKELEGPKIKDLRGLDGLKVVYLQIGDLKIGVAAASGLGNAKKLLKEIKNGRNDIHFIEVMTCPGGCINGGGQPQAVNIDDVKARMKALYTIDRDAEIRTSHGNKYIQKLYKDYLGEPLSEKSHKILHTHYKKRDVLL